MTAILKRISRRFFIILNLLAVFVFLLACLSAYINPGTYWYIGVFGVGFVFFLIAVIIFFIAWLLVRSRWALLSLAALVIGWYQIYVVFGFNAFAEFDPVKPEGSIRIMQWNVTSWDELNKKQKDGNTYRREMFDYLASEDADVLCFQEFFESSKKKYFDPNVDYIKTKLSYPYHYFVVDNSWWRGEIMFGIAVFSRYPIVDSIRYRYSTSSQRPGESLIGLTLDVNGQKINVFTTHLQSFQFKDTDYNNIAILKNPENNKGRVLSAGKGLLSKFRDAYRARYAQADMVREKLDQSAYPTLITGDFNDVPNSYTYFKVKGDYQDIFLKKGFGLGKTFHFISPTLRIDYILADSQFEVLQYKRDLLPYSDHYPLVADLRLKESKPQ